MELSQKKHFEYLSSVFKGYMGSLYCAANPVFNKHSLHGIFDIDENINECLEKKDLLFFVIVILKYYLSAFRWIVIFSITLVIWRIIKLRSRIEVYDISWLIDSYILDSSFYTGKYRDIYFGDFTEWLEQRGKKYCYLPRIISSGLSVKKTLALMKNLGANCVKFVSEYDTFSLIDYVKLIHFVVIYPFAIKITCNSIIKKGGNRELYLAHQAVKSIQKSSVCYIYSRYLFSLKLSSFIHKKVSLLSWHENYALEKLFYRGLRNKNTNIKIYACRSSIFPREFIHQYIDQAETAYGLNPDVLLVNGEYYRSDAGNEIVGPSFRYKYLFNIPVISSARDKIVVLLPYYEDQARIFLDVIRKYKLKNILIKFHPATNLKKFKYQYENIGDVVLSPISELLKVSKIIIGVSTGALLEAVCYGVPALVFELPGIKTYNYFPILGKSLVWDSILPNENLELKINYMVELSKRDFFKMISRVLLNCCFKNPTFKLYDELFN